MADLIDRAALMAKSGWYNLTTGKSIHAVEDYEIASMQSVDAVPVVRCKDCDRKLIPRTPKNQVWCRENRCYKKPDDFCSYGERKDETNG